MIRFITPFILTISSAFAFSFPENKALQSHVETAPECSEFKNYISTRGDVNKFNADQLMVLKEGKIAYKWNRQGVFELDQLHIMWSTSKAISSLVAAAAIQKKMTYIDPNGENAPFNQNTPIHHFLPFDLLTKNSPVNVPFDPREEYEALTIRNLYEMNSGLNWAETYESLLDSSFLPILYGDERERGNIIEPTMDTFMIYKAGQYFNYSGGNMIMMMKIIGDVYCQNFTCDENEFSKSNKAAKELLFHPLGIEKGFYETDEAGLVIASSYAYLTPEDMLKLGQLVLNDGVIKKNGSETRILPEFMIKQIHDDNPTFTGAEIKSGSKEEHLITWHGHWNRNGWGWNNLPVVNCVKNEGDETCQSKRVLYKQDFPHINKDFIVFAGHFGDNIIFSKSENLVIATTGQNDDGYWQKLDYFVSKAVQCFNHKKSDAPYPKIKESQLSTIKKIDLLRQATKTSLIHKAFAKDICSCLFVSEVGKNVSSDKALDLCKQNTPSDGPRSLRNTALRVSVEPTKKKVNIWSFNSSPILGIPLPLPKVISARYFGNENGGCRIEGYLD